MKASSRIGPADADILVFNKGGRDARLEQLAAGREAPREFFYGFFDLERAGYSAAMMSSSGPVAGPLGALASQLERGLVWFTGIGARPLSARLAARSINGAKVAISYTDGFSLSLGLGVARHPRRPILMGGFHGLSDMEQRSPPRARALARRLVRRSLAGLDHAFFFGPADRAVAMERYGVAAENSSVIPFGVDTEFWRPLPNEPAGDFVLAVGQDPNRDYDLLAATGTPHPVRIVTRQKVNVPADASRITIVAGDFYGRDAMSDDDLRRAYNAARAVVVPLKDVWQPSGYSVTLQAMSCGRPVILTKTRGLWSADLLKDNENCLLVRPGDAEALTRAIDQVVSSPGLAANLGSAARKTALAHFGLDRIGSGTIALARLGLDLAARRSTGF